MGKRKARKSKEQRAQDKRQKAKGKRQKAVGQDSSATWVQEAYRYYGRIILAVMESIVVVGAGHAFNNGDKSGTGWSLFGAVSGRGVE